MKIAFTPMIMVILFQSTPTPLGVRCVETKVTGVSDVGTMITEYDPNSVILFVTYNDEKSYIHN